MKYHFNLPILVMIAGIENEVVANIEYTVTPGHPETPPSYSHGGLPADPPELEILSGTIIGGTAEKLPDWMISMIANNDAAYQTLGDAADWGVPPDDPDYARDYQ